MKIIVHKLYFKLEVFREIFDPLFSEWPYRWYKIDNEVSFILNDRP